MQKVGSILKNALIGALVGTPVAIVGAFFGFDCFAESQFFLAFFIFPVLGLILGALGGIIGSLFGFGKSVIRISVSL
jgi:hypothetical protein